MPIPLGSLTVSSGVICRSVSNLSFCFPQFNDPFSFVFRQRVQVANTCFAIVAHIRWFLKGAALNERSTLVRAHAQLQFMATVVNDERIQQSDHIHTDEQSRLFN